MNINKIVKEVLKGKDVRRVVVEEFEFSEDDERFVAWMAQDIGMLGEPYDELVSRLVEIINDLKNGATLSKADEDYINYEVRDEHLSQMRDDGMDKMADDIEKLVDIIMR